MHVYFYRQDIASGDFTTGPEIQILDLFVLIFWMINHLLPTSVLKKLAAVNTNVMWRIKGDGTDVVKG